MSAKSNLLGSTGICIVYSTTEGRAVLPAIMQDVFGHNVVVGFHRYNRALGAAISMDAVRMLAGYDDQVDPAAQRRIQQAAEQLRQELSI